MAGKSAHLDTIIDKKKRTTSMQVVFMDIVSYSKRKSSKQIEVIDNFTNILIKSLLEVSRKYIDYTQENSVNLANDVISIPTGDGAAVVFTFEGLSDIHLEFAKEFLRINHNYNVSISCAKFSENGWCNCHDIFDVRIGISEGKGILYKDVNDNYNVAGETINLASRVMNKADRAQIMFTPSAYSQIVDLSKDPDFADYFIELNNMTFKHGLKLNIYQYIGNNEEYISRSIPNEVAMTNRLHDMTRAMDVMMPALQGMISLDSKSLPMDIAINMMKEMSDVIFKTQEQINIIETENP